MNSTASRTGAGDVAVASGAQNPRAGIIASSHGRPRATTAPRENVRRESGSVIRFIRCSPQSGRPLLGRSLFRQSRAVLERCAAGDFPQERVRPVLVLLQALHRSVYHTIVVI